MKLPVFIKSRRFERLAQIVLVFPLLLMWAGIFEFYGTRSASLLRMLFPDVWWMAALLLGLPATAFIFTLYRMFKRSPEKLDWSLDILLCLFVGMSMFILMGQIFSL